MSDYQVQVFIPFSAFAGLGAGDYFLVEGMEDGYPLNGGMTGDARNGFQFVDNHGVCDICFAAVVDFFGNVAGNQTAQVGGMFSHYRMFQVMGECVRYFIDS